MGVGASRNAANARAQSMDAHGRPENVSAEDDNDSSQSLSDDADGPVSRNLISSIKTESGGFVFTNSAFVELSESDNAVIVPQQSVAEVTSADVVECEVEEECSLIKTRSVPRVVIDPAVRASLDEEEYAMLRRSLDSNSSDLSSHAGDDGRAAMFASTGSGLSFLNFSQGSFDLDAEGVLDLASSAALGFEWKESGAFAVVVAPTDDSELNPNDVPPDGSFLPPLLEQRALLELNEQQAEAIRYVVRTSRKRTEETFDSVLARVQRLGHSEAEFRQLLRYLRDDAPLIIHISSDVVLPLLAKDTHYRNQFETNTSKGSLDHGARRQWEERMFPGCYTGAEPFDRVKYGVLNMMNDPTGVQSCMYYGDAYLVLKGVRLRTSFASKDSSASDTMMASCEYYVQVLASFSDTELQDAIAVGTGKAASKSSVSNAVYKEVQIHGPVELAKHVECLVLPAAHRGNKTIEGHAKAFCEKHGCWMSWNDKKWWEEKVARARDPDLKPISSGALTSDKTVEVASFANIHDVNNAYPKRRGRWFW